MSKNREKITSKKCLYEAGYRETNARGGSTSLVAQFLQEMRDPGSEQRNRQEIT